MIAAFGGILPAVEVERRIDGKYPQIVANEDRVWLLSTVALPAGGQNLILYQLAPESLKTTGSWQVNRQPGSVAVTSESSALLVENPGRTALYAIWNEPDLRHKFTNRLVSATFDIAQRRWSLPVQINDDVAPTTHSFQAAAVSEDGTIHVAWIDRRRNAITGLDDYTGGGDFSLGEEPDSSLFYARSTDGGKTYDKNRLITGGVCACCRLALAVQSRNVVVAWRAIQSNGVRDITVSSSADGGSNWSRPATAVVDNWKISGCPHSGAALAFSGSTLYLAWMTGVSGAPKVWLSTSQDVGRSFSKPIAPQGSFYYSNHPRLALAGNAVVAVHEGSDGENRTRVFLAAVDAADRAVKSQTVLSSHESVSASYPVVATQKHAYVVAWTASSGEKSAINIVRQTY